tara:strand:+ start:332 stop:511 length:180 start_codon:yes stop_codon:yes gene_type:complete
MNLIRYIWQAERQATGYGSLLRYKKTFRFAKLKYKKESYMFGLLNLKAWDNPPIAPPNH